MKNQGSFFLQVSRLIIVALAFTGAVNAWAEDDSKGGFSPTWKLMTLEQKQQFVAGYLQGWRDAAVVTDIVISYVRKNPQKAVASLEGVKELYNLKSLRSAELVERIDEFYADPSNNSAPLSRAVTAARTQLQ